MTRSMLVAVLAVLVLCVAPQGSIGALEMVENIDGGAVVAPRTTELFVPAGQPDVISRVPASAPRSSSTLPPAVPESLGSKESAPTSTGSEMLADLTPISERTP